MFKHWSQVQTPHLVLAVALESPRQVGAELADSLGLALELPILDSGKKLCFD